MHRSQERLSSPHAISNGIVVRAGRKTAVFHVAAGLFMLIPLTHFFGVRPTFAWFPFVMLLLCTAMQFLYAIRAWSATFILSTGELRREEIRYIRWRIRCRIAFNDVQSAQWKRFLGMDSLVLKSKWTHVVLRFYAVSRADAKTLGSSMRSMLPMDVQRGWERVAARFGCDPVCHACGYRLVVTGSDRCPECGVAPLKAHERASNHH